MDFLAATHVGKFPSKMHGGGRAGGQRVEESKPAGYRRRNKSLRALLDFIFLSFFFPLYSMLTSLSDAFFLSFCLSFFLSFFSVSKGDDGQQEGSSAI